MAEFPAPLTPADCDLRSVPSMLLDVQRFRDSDLVVLEKPEAVLAAILLWGAAWHQVPAASLPDDDRLLAQLAGYGKVVAAWKRVRAGALRGFVKCSDGRLYHPTVAEKAREMWSDKLQRMHGRFCAAVRKHNERKRDQVEAPTFEAWVKLGRPDRLADIICPTADRREDKPTMSHGQTADVACETGSNRTELNGTELNTKPKPTLSDKIPKPSLARARERPPPGITDAGSAMEFVLREADWRPANDSQRQAAMGIVTGWLAFAPLELILAGIASARSRKPNEPTRSLMRFDSTIRGMATDKGIEPTVDATRLIESAAAGMRVSR